jgi:hypothetical protein
VSEGNGAGGMSARERILSRRGSLKEETAWLPGPDGETIPVIVRELTGKQAAEFELALARDTAAPMGLLLQMCLIDPETKTQMFEVADREALEDLGWASLQPIVVIAQRQSGLSAEDIEKAKRDLLRARSRA